MIIMMIIIAIVFTEMAAMVIYLTTEHLPIRGEKQQKWSNYKTISKEIIL